MNKREEKALLVRLPKELHTQAKVMAAQTGRPLSDIVEQLLREWIKKENERGGAK